MGKCRFCHQKAGLFQDSHEACVEKAETNRKLLEEIMTDALKNEANFAAVKPSIDLAKSAGRLSDAEARLALINSLDKVSQKVAAESPMSNEAFERIYELYLGIGYDFQSLEIKQNHWYGYIALAMSNVLYQILHGQLPYYDPTGRMSFQLTHQERPIFSTGRTVLAEYKSISSQSVYQSVGLPIGAGLYYRIGASSTPSHQTGLVPSDEGELLLTTKAIYFGGQKSTFKITYDSILRLESFLDGVGIFQHYGSGKVFIPDYSGMDTGWFFYNLVSALTKLNN
jgi:hypothetical protein